jgi:hypothetical protein
MTVVASHHTPRVLRCVNPRKFYQESATGKEGTGFLNQFKFKALLVSLLLYLIWCVN